MKYTTLYRNRSALLAGGIMMASLASASQSHAAQVLLVNPNFTANNNGSADNGLGFDQGGAAEVPGWSQDLPVVDSGVADTGGLWSAELNQDNGNVYQTSSHSILNGDMFTLTFDAKNAFQGSEITVVLYRLDSGPTTRTPLATRNATVGNTFASFSLSYTALPADAGKPIGIEFFNASNVAGGESWASFDNFVLDVVSVPEPTSMAVLGSGLGVLALRRRRNK